jgi:AbrB family looped-hinge helix DNA binding protein
MAAPKPTTTVSTKGQVVLPAELRRRQGWKPGTRLTAEETPEGVLLRRSEPLFPPTRLEDVYGCLRYDGPPISIEDMDAGIEAAVTERYRRSKR